MALESGRTREGRTFEHPIYLRLSVMPAPTVLAASEAALRAKAQTAYSLMTP